MMITDLFKAIDTKDTGKFVSFISSDCKFRFGNFPVVAGKEAIREFVSGFFDSIDALSHKVEEHWEIDGGLVCHGQVSYTRKDGSVLTVPFANIFKMDFGKIADYLIFADTSELYQ
jgi:hypothetical protein